MSKKKFFTVTDNHIKLAKMAKVSWDECEFGAPGIDPKRPYGESGVLLSIAEIIGLKLFINSDEEKQMSKEQVELCQQLHCEMETVLQILLSNCHLEAGKYEAEEYSSIWVASQE